MIKVISFDLDGTLVDASYGDAVWNHGIPRAYAEEFNTDFNEARDFVRSQYHLLGDGSLLWYDIEYWLRRFGLGVTSEWLLEQYEPYIRLTPFAGETLAQLADNFKLVIASNAARIFVEKELGYTGLGSYFGFVVSATSDYGLVKKDIAFYRRLCASLDVSPEEVVHVGDHPVFDHDVPLSAGICSYFVNGVQPAGEEQDGVLNNGRRTIKNLKNLLDKL